MTIESERIQLPELKEISELAHDYGIDIYLVGGFVRDILLDRPSKDIDIVAVGSGVNFAKYVSSKFSKVNKLTVFENFGTANICIQNSTEIEIVGARKESYDRHSRKPIVEDGTLADDLLRRDFTVNAIAISLNKHNYGAIVDKFDGLSSIKNRVLDTPTNPNITFSDDPLRMLRAVRFVSQLGFELSDSVHQAIVENVDRLDIISAERIHTELNKLLNGKYVSEGLTLMYQTGLLYKVLPEFKGLDSDIIIKTFKFLQLINNSDLVHNIWVKYAALLIHFDANSIENIFRYLKLPLSSELRYVNNIVQCISDKIHYNSSCTVYQLRTLLRNIKSIKYDFDILFPLYVSVFLESDNFDDLNLTLNTELLKEWDIWELPITGNDVMEILDISPSKRVGSILSDIETKVLSDELDKTPNAILDYIKSLKN